MKIINSAEFHIAEPTAAAIGKFDGIHLGHQKLLRVLLQAKELGLAAAVFTFVPSPAVFFGRGRTVHELSTREEKRRCFAALGVDYLIEFPLNAGTAATEPEEYIRRYLVEQMNVRYLVAGNDISFGAGGRGNFALLDRLSDRYSYLTQQVDKLRIEGVAVSSTYIRELIQEGRMEEAAKFLGGPYSVLGEIVRGNQIGRTIGIPTLNQVPEEGKLLPPFGVYYSEVVFRDAGTENEPEPAGAGMRPEDGAPAGERRYYGMTNIGIKPTIREGKRPGERPPVTVETYLYDFDGDVYGRTAECRLLGFRRPERHFASLEALRETMDADIEAGEKFHAGH
ncbi:bifunctional riboflavin kinase/FMN adenylyltransferase [Lachnoclostridium sp. Marseille-P6806]|uniref:bifunctional riboflavin kinase/FMN adenylyltransferase n=1 Tax=Lachnoclostridium sp. Marseille-P6806 TaxID=2364793 RepID=UPI001030FF14|nr:bifunctional riboflavin kinase/FMN adenylyltransferase [Lachnoclostridium sp. Marseille-P6806]